MIMGERVLLRIEAFFNKQKYKDDWHVLDFHLQFVVLLFVFVLCHQVLLFLLYNLFLLELSLHMTLIFVYIYIYVHI